MRRLLYNTLLLFALLVAGLLPFPWRLFSFQQHLLPRLFGAGLYRSDSAAQALLYGLLAAAALLLVTVIRALPARWRLPANTASLLRGLLLAWLAAVLARYGADKLFKTQFYLPEPTTLYTPFGRLDKDILYWSTIGTSRPYNLFLGGTELLAAGLLLFPRNRRAGLLLALTVFLQVLAVDLCFGIGVRLFSGFLLVLTLLLLAPDAQNWLRFFTGAAAGAMERMEDRKPQLWRRWGRWARAGVLLLVVTEALWPALRSGNWNDDAAARPPLHGAYEVLEQLPQERGGLPPARRVLVHRAGYLVLQDVTDRLHPFPYYYDTAQQLLRIHSGSGPRSYRCTFRPGDSLLLLYAAGDSSTPVLRARALDWRSLPALN